MGRKGVADLSDALKGPVFDSLKNKLAFSTFAVDQELETIVWPNGADLAPEFIYFLAFRNEAGLQSQFRKWGMLINTIFANWDNNFSLEAGQDEDVDEAWAELAEKRYLELQSGVVTGLLWKEVKNAVKNRDA